MPIFISYSFEDSAGDYDSLRNELTSNGIDTWHTRSMQVGGDLASQLRNAIERCSLCIFIASSKSLNSGWCKAEIGAFWGANKNVLIYEPESSVIEDGEIPAQFSGALRTSDRHQLLESVSKLLYPSGRLKVPPVPGGAAVVVLSGAGRDQARNEAIGQSIQASGLAERIQQIDDFEMLGQDEFDGFGGVFLSMPFRTRLSQRLIRRLVAWVRRGGKMVVCGYELGQWHHGSNINELTSNFGLQFRSDVIVGDKGQVNGKQYNVMQQYTGFAQPDHPVLDGVSQVMLTNACSLYLEPGSRPLILVAPNRILELDSVNAEYSREGDSYELAPGQQTFLRPYSEAGRAVMAEGPPELSAKGTVITLGTWDFRAGQSANARFLQNLFGWLASTDI